MSDPESVQALMAISRSFGPAAAREKKALLRRIAGQERLSGRELVALGECLCFLRAYPDDPGVLRLVETLIGELRERVQRLGARARRLRDTGLPGTVNSHEYSFPVLERMTAILPGLLEIDWDELEDTTMLQLASVLLVTPGEWQGLDDISMTMPQWTRGCRGSAHATDLEFLLSLCQGSELGLDAKAFVFDSCGLRVRYELAREGTGTAEMLGPRGRVHYQKGVISRERLPLAREIRRPFRKVATLPPAGGRDLVDLALRALCARNLEIRTLMYASEDDVILLDCGRGMRVGFIGVIPEYRDVLESSYCFLILKNGVPIAYGPASVCFGCCEMGINLFPEFRGCEIRFLYPQFMRAIHHALGARYFFLTAYGMGEGNPEAIRSGAFWFYRKLGFRATNPEVEALALGEEERMRARPGYRSDRRMLRRLSRTDAHFDLSDGACRRMRLGPIGVGQSVFIAEEFGGDRRLAEKRCIRRVVRVLDIHDLEDWSPGERHGLRLFAPLLCMIEGLASWPRRDLTLLRRIVRARGGRHETLADRLMQKHPRLEAALRQLRKKVSDTFLRDKGLGGCGGD